MTSWFLAFPVALLVATAAPKDEPAKGDREQLQGTWAFVSGEQNGKPVKDGNIILTFTADTMIRQEGKERVKMAYKIDSTKEPKTIDVVFTVMYADRDETVVNLGIFKVEGDSLTLCLSGKERPKQFATKPGEKHQLMILKRVKK